MEQQNIDLVGYGGTGAANSNNAIGTAESKASSAGWIKQSEDSGWTQVSENVTGAGATIETVSEHKIYYDQGTVTITRTQLKDASTGSVISTTFTDNAPSSSSSSSSGSNSFRTSGDSSKVLYFTNYARLFLNVKDNDEDIAMSVGYLIIYIALITFTAVFTFRYIKRVIYIAFLTMIAPVVAITYPLDKIKDSKAQAWNMWFKEYVFNVIIQPFHMILYTILVGSALELAHTSLIYSIVAIYFLIPAEKLLRKFFGFDNAGTLSAAGSFAGGAVFSAMINKMNRPKPRDDKEKDDKPKMRKPTGSAIVDAEGVLFGGSGGVGRRFR